MGQMADGYDDDSSAAPESEQLVLKNSAFLLQLVCLASAFVIGLVIKHYRVRWLHEAGATLLLGIGVGFVIWSANTTQKVTRWLDFNEEVFFFLLLPPIIFESGFSLHTREFFSNFGGICGLAFAGTAISTFTVGIFVWLCGVVGICTSLPFLHALIFGALISATDPVTVLAVFQALGVKVDLFSMVFGESVLNDAVAIVLSRTLLGFNVPGTEVNSESIMAAVSSFCTIFGGSLLIEPTRSFAPAGPPSSLCMLCSPIVTSRLHGLATDGRSMIAVGKGRLGGPIGGDARVGHRLQRDDPVSVEFFQRRLALVEPSLLGRQRLDPLTERDQLARVAAAFGFGIFGTQGFAALRVTAQHLQDALRLLQRGHAFGLGEPQEHVAGGNRIATLHQHLGDIAGRRGAHRRDQRLAGPRQNAVAGDMDRHVDEGAPGDDAGKCGGKGRGTQPRHRGGDAHRALRLVHPGRRVERLLPEKRFRHDHSP